MLGSGGCLSPAHKAWMPKLAPGGILQSWCSQLEPWPCTQPGCGALWGAPRACAARAGLDPGLQ